MTTYAPGEQWSFGGVSLNTLAYLIRRMTGGDSMPPLRGENAAFSGLPGRRALPKVEDERRVGLALWVQGVDADGVLIAPTHKRQARINVDELKRVLGNRHLLQPLVRTMPDGTTRTAQAECVAVDEFEDPASGELYGLVADFMLADPYLYGANVVVPQAIAASPTNFNLTNPGNRRGHKMVIDYTGPIASPRLANMTIDPTGDHYVELLVTVAAGEHGIIDVEQFLATNDGVNAIGSVRHSGALPFLEMDPGVNALRVTSSAPGGSVQVTFKPPYI